MTELNTQARLILVAIILLVVLATRLAGSWEW